MSVSLSVCVCAHVPVVFGLSFWHVCALSHVCTGACWLHTHTHTHAQKTSQKQVSSFRPATVLVRSPPLAPLCASVTSHHPHPLSVSSLAFSPPLSFPPSLSLPPPSFPCEHSKDCFGSYAGEAAAQGDSHDAAPVDQPSQPPGLPPSTGKSGQEDWGSGSGRSDVLPAKPLLRLTGAGAYRRMYVCMSVWCRCVL